MDNQKKMFAVAYNKTKTSMIGQMFSDRKTAEKYLPIYEKKGWTGGIVEVDAPKPLSDEEKEDLKEASKFLKQIVGVIR